MTTQVAGEVIPSDKPNSFAMAIRQPAGVVLGIAPWNAPVILGVRAIAMPLACGNTVVLKASEMCPARIALIGTIMREAGLPQGVVNVVTNAPDDAAKMVETLIAHPAVRRINFTGSTKVGPHHRRDRGALSQAGAARARRQGADGHPRRRRPRRGGEGRGLRLLRQHGPDLHVDRAASIVDEKVADAFVEKFAAKARSLPHGDPRGHVILGSLVTKEAVARNKELLDDAVAKGAKVVAGGEFNGTVVSATVLDRVTPAMRIYTEESFGPVKPVIRVKDVEEAIRIANDTEYGLSAAVFGKDVARALGVAKRIQSGICHINAPTVHDEGADAVRRHQGVGLRPLRRQGGDRRVHRAALDHDPDRAASLSVLASRNGRRAAMRSEVASPGGAG